MAVLTLALAGQAGAQDAQNPFGGGQANADPFGGAPGGNAAGGGQAGADPFGGGPAVADPFGGPGPGQGPAVAPPGAGDGQQPRPGGLPIGKDETNPVVLAIRDMNPTTPTDLLFAVRSLLDIGRTDEAKFFLIKLIEARPDRDVLLGFHREYGESFFHRLQRDHRMTPEGEQFADAVLQVAHQAAHDPQRLRDLVKQLASSSPVKRYRAIDALRRVEYSAVPLLLEALADPARSQEQPAVRSAIPELGAYLLEPMLGALETPDVNLRMQVIQVLGQFRSPRALGQLVGPLADPDSPDDVRRAAARSIVEIVGQVPDRSQVERFLYERASDYYDGMLPGRLDHEDRITLWTWDAQQKTSVARRFEAKDASRLYAARLARDLYHVASDSVPNRRLYLLTNLEFAKYEAGLDKPLDLSEGSIARQAAAVGVDALEDLLSYAMETRRPVAATAAAELLGSFGDADLVQSTGGQPRTLVLALRDGDRRLRMAAAEAILRLDPQSPYAGSSYLTEALGFMIRTVGSRRVLVAHPRLDKSQSLVGLLLEMGFEADSASTGREAFRLASRSPDYEFVLISDALDRPSAHETIQMMRKDPRTSRLVVGLMGRQETLRSAETFAETDPLVLAFPRPLDATGMSFQAGRLLRLAGRDLVGYDERLDQAEQALDSLLRLTEQPRTYDFYDLYRQTSAFQVALSTPQLATKAATLLGRLGSPEAQRSLVTAASQHGRPLSIREAAATAFADAVQRRGLLLSRDEILLQYERYNQSEYLDVGTQKVLGAVLDAIEAPSEAAKTQTEPQGQESAAS